MKNVMTAGVAVFAILAAQTGIAFADQENMKKLGGALEHVYNQSHAAQPATIIRRSGTAEKMGRAGPNNALKLADVSDDGYVTLDAIASGAADDLAVTIESLGGRNVSTYGRVVSSQFPADRLGDLSNSGTLAFARPAFRATNVGLVTSQGDRSMGTDAVRANLGLTEPVSRSAYCQIALPAILANSAADPIQRQQKMRPMTTFRQMSLSLRISSISLHVSMKAAAWRSLFMMSRPAPKSCSTQRLTARRISPTVSSSSLLPGRTSLLTMSSILRNPCSGWHYRSGGG